MVDDAGDSLGIDASCVLFGFLVRRGSVFPRFFPSMQWLLMNLRNSGFGFSMSVDTTKCSPTAVAQEDKHVRNEVSFNTTLGTHLPGGWGAAMTRGTSWNPLRDCIASNGKQCEQSARERWWADEPEPEIIYLFGCGLWLMSECRIPLTSDEIVC